MRYKMFSLGYEIIDHCNLNCKYCCHLSNLKVANEKSVEFISKDIKFLSDNVELEEFKISGGEPLLHSDICGVMIAARKIMGNQIRISLLTNGIKLSSMPDEFFRTAKYLNINISIARYPIKAKYDEAIEKLKAHGVSYGVLEVTEFGNIFKRVDPTGNQVPEESFKFCRTRHPCPYYEDGQIYICRATKNATFVNKMFGYNIEYNTVFVNEPSESIDRYLTSPCSTCRFCKKGVHMELWSTS